MFKKCQVVMLPTEKANINKGQLYVKSHKKGNIDNSLVNSKLEIAEKYLDYEDRQNIIFCAGGDIYLKSQHLYIISDDVIKEGDWYFNPAGNQIVKCEYKHETIACKQEPVCKKIIATTDSSLIIYEHQVFRNGLARLKEVKLPQPSQSFIEKYIKQYNKENIITDVMVEYQDDLWVQDYATTPISPLPPMVNLGGEIKVNTKDNTITIKRIQDTFTREEVIELLHRRTYETTKDIMDNI